MERKKLYSKPYDLCHSIMFNDFPAEYTKSLNVPGNFVEKINRKVHLKDGTGGEMDSAYIADPDYEILSERVAVGLEHQFLPVDDKKLGKFGDYDIQLVSDENLATFLVVATNTPIEKSKRILKRSPSDITALYFLDLGEENIRERLSIVSKIINSNQYLSIENTLNLGIIPLFAPEKYKCEITEKIVELYQKIVDNLDLKMEYCLYSVIYILIDAYFDDEKEYMRLIKMLNDETSPETKALFESQKSTIESLKFAREDLEYATNKLNEQNKQLYKTNKELNEANGKIAQLEAEVEKLKKLNEK